MRLCLVLVILALCCPQAAAQKKSSKKIVYPPLFQYDDYISVSVGGGLSTLLYGFEDARLNGMAGGVNTPTASGELDSGGSQKRKNGLGGAFNIDYNHFFGERWGASVGLGASLSNSRAQINSAETVSVVIPEYYGDSFQSEYYITYKDWEEKQRTLSIDLPIGLLYRQPLSQKLTLLGGAGVMISLPFKTTYTVTKGDRTTTGNVGDLALDIFPDMEHHGYGVNKPRPKGETDTKKIGAGLTFELSLVQKLRKVFLFYGFYGRFGLTGIGDGAGGITDSRGQYQGILASEAASGVKPLAAGLRVGIKIPLGKGKATANPKDKNTSSKKGEAKDQNKGKDKVKEGKDKDKGNGKDKDKGKGGSKPPKKSTAKPPKNKPQVSQETQKVFDKALHGIHFDVDKSIIKPDSYGVLDEVVKIMVRHPNYKLYIKGHTDNSGSHGHNMKLSRNRAAAVRQYLIARGIAPARLRSDGFGETQPIDTNETAEGKAKNRRVEFEVE